MDGFPIRRRPGGDKNGLMGGWMTNSTKQKQERREPAAGEKGTEGGGMGEGRI